MTDIAPVDQEESLIEPLLSEQQTEASDAVEQEEQEQFSDTRQDEPAILPHESCRDSLAGSASIPTKIIIPLLAVITHLIFIYGQTRPMWRLTTRQQVDVYATATTLPARLAFDTLGLNRTYHLYVEEQEQDIRSFTYAFAIHELWMARHMPGSKFLPRLAAILLTLVSGVWPHLKLAQSSLYHSSQGTPS